MLLGNLGQKNSGEKREREDTPAIFIKRAGDADGVTQQQHLIFRRGSDRTYLGMRRGMDGPSNKYLVSGRLVDCRG